MSRPGLIVIKFGGTALASARRVRRAAARIRTEVTRGRRVIAVVSAAGQETDQILARAGMVMGHGAIADTARELDRVLATGEDRSAGILALALQATGVPARSLRGCEAGIRVRGEFGNGSIEGVTTSRLDELLSTGLVPVVSGFQGLRADGEILTLGRGGSDITAIALAIATEAESCHIVTDVDAVYDRDPHLYADARPITELTHSELVRLTESGAEVIHPRAARLAAESDLPLRVYRYDAPWSGGGTRIGPVRSGRPLRGRPIHELLEGDPSTPRPEVVS